MSDTLARPARPAFARPGLAGVWGIVRLSFFLGWQDVRLMYRRSVLGQFWITLSMIVTFAAIGVVFGLIFRSPIVEYLPFLGCGLVLFNFLSLILNEGATSFITSASFLQQLPLSPLTFFLRSVWKTLFVLLHNAVALAILLIALPQGFSPAVLLVVPGLLLATTAMAGLALGLAMLSTRFRDVPQIVASVIQVSFYLTPIVWLPSAVPSPAREVLLGVNPFYPLIEIMRQPLLNEYPSPALWLSAAGLAAAFVLIGCLSYLWKRRALPFWV